MTVRYGPTFYQVLGLLSAHEFASKAELARELSRVNGRPVARQQVYTIVREAVEAGYLPGNPFPAMGQMRRTGR